MRRVLDLTMAVAIGLTVQLNPSVLLADPGPPRDEPLYTGGGVTLTQADIDHILADAGPRGGGAVFIVECSGAYGYATIQQAIDASSDGDVVVVLPNDCNKAGSYCGFDFLDKDIRVQSAFPADPDVVAATIVGTGACPWPTNSVTLDHPDLQDAALDGLTLRGVYTKVGSNLGQITINRCVFRDINGNAIYSLRGQLMVIGCTFKDSGAGIESLLSQVTVIGCTFSHNAFGIKSDGSQLTVIACAFTGSTWPAIQAFGSLGTEHFGLTVSNCEFSNNGTFTTSGAGINSNDNNLLVEDSRFFGNHASNKGGAIAHFSGELHVNRCEFVDNSATMGGAIHCTSTSLQRIADCSFEGNHATAIGGALKVEGGFIKDSEIARCSFVGNSSGIGAALSHASARVTSCLFVGNSADIVGGGIYAVPPYTVLTDCVFWDNRALQTSSIEQQQIHTPAAQWTVAYSCIQGLDSLAGNGNIGDDPLFVDPGRWDNNGTPSNPSDDLFVVGDYHLLPWSPCIDAGDPNYMTDMGIVDFDGAPRVMHCRVDMGVDEVTLPDPLPGDFDDSGALDMADLVPFVEALLGPTVSDACIGDLTGDDMLDGRDIAALVDALLGA